MKIDIKLTGVLTLLVVAVAVGLYFQLGGQSDERVADDDASVRSRLIREQRNAGKARVRQKRETARFNNAAARIEREKPKILKLEDDEEAKLNDFSRKILQDLQDALDSENFSRVSKLVAKMLEIPPDPKFGKDGVAALLRRKAVEALGWFGAKAMPELVGMLADADPEIVQATFDQFSLALEDISLSDYERADIVVMAAKVLKNSDDLEMLLMEINNMRHSVGAGALVEICLEGTDAAKMLMPEAIEFFTGEDNLKTVEDVEKWLAENPDGEDDDDLYGGDCDE